MGIMMARLFDVDLKIYIEPPTFSVQLSPPQLRSEARFKRKRPIYSPRLFSSTMIEHSCPPLISPNQISTSFQATLYLSVLILHNGRTYQASSEFVIMSPIEDLRSETAKDPLKPNMRVATSESSPERLRDSVRAAPDQSLDDQSDCVDHSTAAFQGSELQISSSASLLRQPEVGHLTLKCMQLIFTARTSANNRRTIQTNIKSR